MVGGGGRWESETQFFRHHRAAGTAGHGLTWARFWRHPGRCWPSTPGRGTRGGCETGGRPCSPSLQRQGLRSGPAEDPRVSSTARHRHRIPGGETGTCQTKGQGITRQEGEGKTGSHLANASGLHVRCLPSSVSLAEPKPGKQRLPKRAKRMANSPCTWGRRGTSSQARLRNGDRPPAGLHTLMSVLGDSVSSTNRSTQACRSPEAQMSARTGSHLARAPRKVNNCTGSWPKMTPDCLPGGALATSESVVGINPARRTLNLRELRSLHTHH